MALNDLYSAGIVFSLGDVRTMNVLHFQQLVADGAEDPEAQLAQGIGDHILADLLPNISADASHVETHIKCISPNPRQTRIFAGAGAGASANQYYPPQAAVNVTLYSATQTRSGRGRMKLAGIPLDMVENTNVDGGWITAIETFLANLLQAWNTAGSLITWLAKIYSVVDAAGRTIIYFKVDPNVRRQSSRRK